MSGVTKIILLSCGSFNPVTNMHLRIFEVARDYLRMKGAVVLGGIISPVHDSYKKAGLVSSTHRCNMVEEALKSSNWIKLDKWECNQKDWSTTLTVLKHHLSYAKKNNVNDSVSVKLLAGADLLESFAVPNLWKPEDIEDIVKNYGMVVISRSGSNPEKFIAKSEMLTKYKENIEIVEEWITNNIQATALRKALKEGHSIKYLTQDSVIDYIYQNGLYEAKNPNK